MTTWSKQQDVNLMTPNQNVLFCGDLHGEFSSLIELTRRHKPVALVLAGDIQAKRPLERELAEIVDLTEVWWIQGNHDTDDDQQYDNLFRSGLAHRNLDGRVVNIAGLRIAGLGGVFRSQVWTPPSPPRFDNEESYIAKCGKGNLWRDGLPRRHRSTIFPNTVALLRQHSADVLVSHEAPSCHPHGFREIDSLIEDLGVTRAFHGHHHTSTRYPRWGSWQAFGLGERAVMTIDGEIVQ